MSLLIARIEPQPSRRGSLKPLWAETHREITAACADPVVKAQVQVLDARETEWLVSNIEIDRGVLKISYAGQVFARVQLTGATIIGHIAKRHIQLIESKQAFLFKLQERQEYVSLLSTLLCWASARPAGLDNKICVPTVAEPKIEDDPMLVCSIEFSRAHIDWQAATAILLRAGVLEIGELSKSPIHSLNIRDLYSHQVRHVDSSVAGQRVLVVGSVYLRLPSDADFDDWYVTLKSFTKQLVFSPIPADVKKSVRKVRNIKISGLSIRVSKEHPALSPQIPGSIDAEDLDFSNTYIELLYNDSVYGRTYLHTAPEVPYWMQVFNFSNVPESQVRINLKYTETGHVQSENLGIGAASLEEGKEWVVLDNPSVPISVHATMALDECFVLDSSYYSQLREQALDLSAGLAYKLGNAIPQDMAVLCDSFFSIYLAERKQTEWIEFLIASEIDETAQRENSTATMFRGNSMMTRGIEKYLQTIGRRVLEKTIGRFVRKVLNTDDTFELDPSRVSAQLASQGVPNDAEAVDKVVAANRITITNYMVFIWTLIRKEPLPDHFKWVFTFLSETMRTKLGITNVDTIYSAVSAFLFLRFYCPALLNPQLFDLFESAVTPANQRALTLIAKLLQGFANRVKFGSKEPWLMPMNSFLDKYESDLTEWYGTLVSYSGQRPRERAAKEAPLDVYMDNQLSNPFLVDEWAQFAKLAKWAADVSFDKSWGTVITRFFGECKRIGNSLQQVLDLLDAPDEIDGSCRIPTLHVNWDLCLFSNNQQVITAQQPQALLRPEKKSVWSKLIGR